MTDVRRPDVSRRWVLAGLILLQAVCAALFTLEVSVALIGVSVLPLDWRLHEAIEIGAALGLVLGVAVTAVLLRTTQRRADHVESQLRAASGAFMELLEDRFTEWGLTPAERDVALFALKGLSTQDIASVRDTSEGTVKAQTNSIYRKAGVSGRTQLLSLFIEDLMGGPLPRSGLA
ncbi:MAG: LuxR C-terminal-related transcriptional regulator [Pseudomonadota bacterium]